MSDVLTLAVERAKAAGTAVESTNGWTGSTRALGDSNLQEDDIFIIPENVKVYENPNLVANGNAAQFCYAELVNEAGESLNRVAQVYPKGTFNRTVFPFTKDADGNIVSTREPAVHSDGKPCEDFASVGSIADAMKLIAGKKIRVKAVQDVQTRDYNDRSKLTLQRVLTLEYV